MALNGGPMFKFSEAISLVVECKDQKEIDEYWTKLSPGRRGRPLRLAQGQVRPVVAGRSRGATELMLDWDPEKSERVMAEVLTMKKIDLAALKKAYKGQ